MSTKGMNLSIDLSPAGGDARRVAPSARLIREIAGSAIHDVIGTAEASGASAVTLWDAAASVVDAAHEIVVIVDPNNLLSAATVVLAITNENAGVVYQRVDKFHPLTLSGSQFDDLDQTNTYAIESIVAQNNGGTDVEIRCVVLPA